MNQNVIFDINFSSLQYEQLVELIACHVTYIVCSTSYSIQFLMLPFIRWRTCELQCKDPTTNKTSHYLRQSTNGLPYDAILRSIVSKNIFYLHTTIEGSVADIYLSVFQRFVTIVSYKKFTNPNIYHLTLRKLFSICSFVCHVRPVTIF